MKHLKIYESFHPCDDQWQEFITWLKDTFKVKGDEEDLKKLFLDLCNNKELGNDEKATLICSRLTRWGLELNDKLTIMRKLADMQI